MGAYRDSNKAHGLLLVPQKPQKRTILLDNGASRRNLVFPYQLFCIFYTHDEKYGYWLSRLHVPFSQTPLTGTDEQEKFYGLPLRNHEVAHAICFYAWPNHKDKETFIRLVIEQYWASPFMEYNDNFSHWTNGYKAFAPNFPSQWQQATKDRNYEWIFQTPLLQAPYIVNLAKLLEANKGHIEKNGVEVITINDTVTIDPAMLEVCNGREHLAGGNLVNRTHE